MVKPLKAFLTFSMALMPAAYADSISDFKIDTKHQRAYAKIENDQLILNTGKVERRWTLTDAGLQTISLTDLSNKKNWITSPSKADWNYKGYTSKGELTNITAKVSDDQGFASEHIELTAEFKYPDVAVKYIVWAYPNSMGFRTQLKIKALKELDIKNKLKYDITHKHDEYNKTNSSQVLTGETEHLSIDTTGLTKRGIGYYNHTQGRNKAKTPLILEEVVKDGILGWAGVTPPPLSKFACRYAVSGVITHFWVLLLHCSGESCQRRVGSTSCAVRKQSSSLLHGMLLRRRRSSSTSCLRAVYSFHSSGRLRLRVSHRW